MISREEISFQKDKYALEWKEKQENKMVLEECLKKSKDDLEKSREDYKKRNNSAGSLEIEEFYWKIYQGTVDNCYKWYGN